MGNAELLQGRALRAQVPSFRSEYELVLTDLGAVQVSDDVAIDYTTWDWLPNAAAEMEAYVVRLLEESGIKPHDVSARAKSIASFQRKQQAKRYTDPVQQVTDTVAIRIITYSNTDRERTSELIRGRFVVKDGEDRNPGDEKPVRLRGTTVGTLSFQVRILGLRQIGWYLEES
ncbi:hypothetical protein [Arthrobacter sp. D1-29]